MKNVYVISDNIYSALGSDTLSNMSALKEGKSAIQLFDSPIYAQPFYAALLPPFDDRPDQTITRFEKIILNSASDAIKNISINLKSKKTGFILSTTKGNISLIEDIQDDTNIESLVSLNKSADIIADRLGIVSQPVVVSHACISGLLAMITGMRLIQSGLYDDVIVSGGDLITSFIFSGFQSFQAISAKPCRPFDAERDGITLGEAAATVILSSRKMPDSFLLAGGAVSNDANHISGPSRTGEELFLAIHRALTQSGIKAPDVDMISAHGTATRYNDDMEARALNLAELEDIPVNSLKGYYGHTLGAAGLLESVISMHSMRENIILGTRGFTNPGTEKPVRVVKDTQELKSKTCLKTASGFGGCNAAVVIRKY
jgi:3-oxoacyl-[acyl-carrier-protein] synthase I